MQEPKNTSHSPVQPRHLHLVEYKPGNDYQMQLDKQTILNHLLTNNYSIEFNYIIIAKEEITNSDFKICVLANFKNKFKETEIRKLFTEVIETVQMQPIRDTNNEIVVKSVKKQIDAISAITKYDMNFLHTGNSLNPSHFNIRFKVYEWSQKHAHLDIDSDEVQTFIENNKYKLNVSCIRKTFEIARSSYLQQNLNTTSEALNATTSILQDELLSNFLDNCISDQNLFDNIDIFSLIEPELMQLLENQ
jgi:hypothetical protein